LQRLDKLLTGDGRGLPAPLKAEIVREIKRLEIVREMIATVEAERDGILKDKRSSHLHADKIKRLAKLKAIGAEFATKLVSEVFYREFASRRQLGSYVGLASSPFRSGPIERDQGISNSSARLDKHVLPQCNSNDRFTSISGRTANSSFSSASARHGGGEPPAPILETGAATTCQSPLYHPIGNPRGTPRQ
jgi:transposase